MSGLTSAAEAEVCWPFFTAGLKACSTPCKMFPMTAKIEPHRQECLCHKSFHVQYTSNPLRPFDKLAASCGMSGRK